jgi:Flp pilus assembly protein TadG
MRLATGGPRAGRRAGIATVEFAAFAIILGMIIGGMIELSRAFQAKEAMTNACRKGASVGIKANKTYADIQAAVDDILSTDQRCPATIANGKARLVVTVATWDASTETYGPDTVVDATGYAPNANDKVSVQVSANTADLNLLFSRWTGGIIEGAKVTMMRQ